MASRTSSRFENTWEDYSGCFMLIAGIHVLVSLVPAPTLALDGERRVISVGQIDPHLLLELNLIAVTAG